MQLDEPGYCTCGSGLALVQVLRDDSQGLVHMQAVQIHKVWVGSACAWNP